MPNKVYEWDALRTSARLVLDGFPYSTLSPFSIAAKDWLACTSVLVAIQRACNPGCANNSS